ncbi:unnamed protein product [Effrenium voratum]|nr:unnamed protein product [Effrenium voratum]
MAAVLLLSAALCNAAPIIRKAQEAVNLQVLADGEVQDDKMTEGALFGNCSYAKMAADVRVEDCGAVEFTNCSSNFVLVNGVKSVCAARGQQCMERGDAFCCFSTSTSPLCDRSLLKASRPRRVASCAAQRRWSCAKSYERHKMSDPNDRVIIVACARSGNQCVGRASPLSDMACCKK